MNTHAGYSKKTLTDTNVLLAGGGDKSLADFLGGIQYVSASHKIQYRAANTNAWSDLVTLVTTDENVKQTPKTDNVNRPLMMINGGTSSGEQTSTSMFSTGIYANASTKKITASGFIRIDSNNTHVLLGGGGHALAGHSNNDSPYIPIADGTVCSTLNADMLDGIHADGLLTAASLGASGNSTTLSVTVGGTTITGSVTVPYATSAAKVTVTDSDANSTYRLVWHNNNKLYSTGGIYCNPSTDCIYATHYYETSDINKKDHIEIVSKHIRKYILKSTGKAAYGVIAQEVPEMFRDGEEGNMTVNYNSVLCYYISILENKVKELEDRLSKLEK